MWTRFTDFVNPNTDKYNPTFNIYDKQYEHTTLDDRAMHWAICNIYISDDPNKLDSSTRCATETFLDGPIFCVKTGQFITF